MNRAWELLYESRVLREDIPLLTKTMRERVRTAIEQKILVAPIYFGKPLRFSLTGQRSLRVGDWRVLYVIEHETSIIRITSIGHRREVYE